MNSGDLAAVTGMDALTEAAEADPEASAAFLALYAAMEADRLPEGASVGEWLEAAG